MDINNLVRAPGSASVLPRARRPFSMGTFGGTLEQVITETCLALRCVVTGRTAQHLSWAKRLEVPVSFTFAGERFEWVSNVKVPYRMAMPSGGEQLRAVPTKVRAAWDTFDIHGVSRLIADSITDLLTAYAADLEEEQLAELMRGLRDALARGINLEQAHLDQGGLTVRDWMPDSHKELLERVDHMRAQKILQLKDYPKSFELARALGRRLYAKLGPTNSGKTFDALTALAAAPSGVYLAPLRLLAIEIRDRLMEQGVPCNLLTGEEHDVVPGAQHTASTIEMMNPSAQVDVAVIDEIQMLEDGDRGWAWTAALIGVPARDVFLCGSQCAQPALEKVANELGEPLTISVLTRKNALELEPFGSSRRGPGRGRGRKSEDEDDQATQLQPGDVVVAFSRKDVLTLSALYRQAGWSVATIYGALAPEVRRAEAERFSNGEADILVATDAIGMGLNLPIRRVVFSSVAKFDGEKVRELLPTELQQIAGRAGRFGLHDKGLVTAFQPEDLAYIADNITAKLPPLAGKLAIAPNLWHIEALATLFGTEKIGPLLSFFANQLATDIPLFKPAALQDAIALGHHVDELIARCGGTLSLEDRFTFARAPVSVERSEELGYFTACLSAALSGRVQHLAKAPAWLMEPEGDRLEEAEQLSKNLSLYAWLSFKFPSVFVDASQVPQLRAILSRYIEQALVRQDGFGAVRGRKPRKA